MLSNFFLDDLHSLLWLDRLLFLIVYNSEQLFYILVQSSNRYKY